MSMNKVSPKVSTIFYRAFKNINIKKKDSLKMHAIYANIFHYLSSTRNMQRLSVNTSRKVKKKNNNSPW